MRRKERRRRRKTKRPKKMKTLRIWPAGRNTPTIMTMRALMHEAIRQKERILIPTMA
jgi:hypothetical protein